MVLYILYYGQRVFLDGGRGNMRLLAFDHSKVSTMKLKLPLVDTAFLATLMGDVAITGTAQNVLKRDVLTVGSGNTATLSATPVAGTTLSAFQLSGLRDNGVPIVAGTPASTPNTYSITGVTLTLNATSNPVGSQVVVWYTYATPTTATKFSMIANKFVSPIKLVGTGIVKDQQTGLDRISVITIYNAKIQPTFNFVMSSTAATSLDLTLDMFSVSQGGNNVYYDCVFLA